MLAIAVAAISVLGALIVYFLTQRAAAHSRKREACASAIADALQWLEIPYRIRRRVDDQPETIAAITGHIHGLQESILFHLSWLRVELPAAHDEYHQLVTAVKTGTGKVIQESWESAPAHDPKNQNLGPIVYDRSRIDVHLERLTNIIRQRFG